MPTYDFRCQVCGHEFTKSTSIAGRSQVQCPACASNEVQQRFTGFFFAKSGGGSGTASGGSCSRSSCAGCSGC